MIFILQDVNIKKNSRFIFIFVNYLGITSSYSNYNSKFIFFKEKKIFSLSSDIAAVGLKQQLN